MFEEIKFLSLSTDFYVLVRLCTIYLERRRELETYFGVIGKIKIK